MNSQELFQRAQTDLSAEERTHLALALIDDAGSQLEVAQLLESATRMDSIRIGEMEVRPADEMMADIKTRLGIVKPS